MAYGNKNNPLINLKLSIEAIMPAIEEIEPTSTEKTPSLEEEFEEKDKYVKVNNNNEKKYDGNDEIRQRIKTITEMMERHKLNDSKDIDNKDFNVPFMNKFNNINEQLKNFDASSMNKSNDINDDIDDKGFDDTDFDVRSMSFKDSDERQTKEPNLQADSPLSEEDRVDPLISIQIAQKGITLLMKVPKQKGHRKVFIPLGLNERILDEYVIPEE